MTKLSYWERRYLQTKAKEIHNTEAYERALQPQLDGLFRELSAETSKWVDRYAKNQGIDSDAARQALAGIHTKHWELTLKQFREKAKAGGYEDELDAEYFRSRVARLQSLEQQLRSYTQPHAQDLTNSMRKALADQYNDTYMRTNYNLQARRANFSADFAHFNDAQLRIAVSQPWGKDGKDFSQRIWKNYQRELPSYLMDAVLRGTIMGYGPQKVTQMMHARFQDVKRNNVHRLVVSEMAHVAEEATARSYEENEIEQYEYMATLESHTCDVCAKLDGQVFKVSERKPGINYPVIHGRCRCTTVPYIKGLPEVGKRWSRDPETGKGKLIKNVNFNEWKDMVGKNKSVILQSGAKLDGSVRSIGLSNMASAVGTKNFDKFNESLQNLKDKQLNKVFEKLGGELEFSSLHDGVAYVQSGKIHLAQKSFDGTPYKRPVQTVYHEIGHAFDMLGLRKVTGKSTAQTGVTVKRRVFGRRTEVPVLVGQLSGLPKYQLKQSITDDLWSYINGDLPQLKDIGPKPRKKIEKQKWLSEQERIVRESTENLQVFRSKYQALAKMNIQKYSALSDIIESTGIYGNQDYILGIGHGYRYWKNAGTAETEFVAHMTETIAANPDSYEVLHEIFPKSEKIYRQLLTDLLESGD